ncbi:MAG: hypothetical protein CRU78_11335 [Candidatus Accumulibacter phosphatis]|jgi:hypothetical protein|uniref:Uncharacterized protein n=1 Tax=Candidatus Accumulibacter phosphatis TaxID=327160 RepID=A0A6A7RU21_9PROT|nr:hypothetical protein [Candidatus Accumulibacter phosphatis]
MMTAGQAFRFENLMTVACFCVAMPDATCKTFSPLLAGEPFSEVDRERLILATSRIQAAMTAAGVTHHG